ncbi:hypothetical protein F5Y10DRAFT_288746 [Nemania abortiva]|nr:hypothetical protein F5Y10DRAFT_288746 [Nemania abortiva]
MANQSIPEPVAIVGMGCRWPGGVRDAPGFWEFLKDKVDGWREFDDPRFSVRGFHHPNTDRPGTFAMRGAYLAEEDARLFDHSFFRMTGLEVETLDPSQRKLLEVTYEAFENAGETWESVSGTRTGVFVGNFCLDHWMIQSRDWDNPRPYAFTGAGTSILANRISYVFNLNGPSLTVDTACSSSMYALHLAMNAIRAGDCDAAVVASANWIADPGVQIALDKLGALSASGRSHTFDSRAQGYARGEGYGAIYLKRASVAAADGSPMRALIRGSSMNANGRTGGITRPSPAGQEAVIREAYRNAGNLPFTDTSYFECHGTGTYVGDPLEVAAVGNVFAGERPAGSPLLVGSVKTNVGHTEGASALASIMKVVLSLEHKAIPPIFDLQTLNPNIDFEGTGVEVVRDLTEWPSNENNVRRASINSFGYGGANGHCIIDDVQSVFPNYVLPGVYHERNLASNRYHNGHHNGNGYQNRYHNGYHNGHQNRHSEPRYHPPIASPKLRRAADAESRQLVLLPFSAHNKESLKLNIDALSGVISNFSLADVAYTMGAKRSRLPQRTFRIVDKDDPAQGLRADDQRDRKSPLQPSNVAFVFTGQGAQWPAMGAELLEHSVFRSTISYLDHVLSSLPIHPSWTLSNILSGEMEPELIQSAEISQTACTALQIGIVDLLASWSVQAVAVAGHSSGEIGAAYASGYVTAAEAIVAAYFRGQAVARNQQEGLMLAVGLDPDQAFHYLVGFEEKARIAAYNSPGSVTLSGDAETIKSISAALDNDGVFNRVLKTGGNAYHSHHMFPLGRRYDALLSQGLAHVKKSFDRERYPQIPWMSSVTPRKKLSEANFREVAYWRANLESPVRFFDAIENLVSSDKVQVIIEVGPHPALKSPIQQILKKLDKASSVSYTSTLKRHQDALEAMLELAGNLFCLNAEVNLSAVNAVDGIDSELKHGTIAVDLPPYQYAYGPVVYHESRQSKEYRYRDVIRHDLLGSKIPGNANLRPQWRNILRVKDVPWLNDHRLLPDMVLPAAGYVAMAVEAASRAHQTLQATSIPLITGYALRDVAIKSGLRIPEDDYGIEVITTMEFADTATTQSPSWASFSVSSVTRESGEWTEHCVGLIRVETLPRESESKISEFAGARSAANIDRSVWYKRFAAIGLGYGAAFQPLSEIRADKGKNKVMAQVSLQTTKDTIKGGESPYVLHPASLDGAIQLGLIACHKGQASEANTAFIPVHFSQLYLSAHIPDELESARATAQGERRNLRNAYLDLALAAPDGREFLRVENLRCTSFSRASQTIEKAYSSPFTRLVWKPDIRGMNNDQCRRLFTPTPENIKSAPHLGVMNRLAHAIVYNIYETFAGDGSTVTEPAPAGEVGHFFDWIKRRGTLDDNEIRREFKKLSSAERLARIDEIVSQAPGVIEVQTSKLLHDNMADILAERRTGIDVIISAGLLAPLYDKGLFLTGAHPQFYRIINSLGHANPNLRYFEIGGGTGGATRIAMRALRGPNGLKSYKDYTFTDISPGFLTTAREALSDAGLDGMIYNVLDVEKDPETLGYEPVYDVVVACQVLHASSNMKRTLTNVGKLLKPGGKLILQESTSNSIIPAVVVGTFTGFWAGIPDGRVDTPFMSLETWDANLRATGFSGTELVLDDYPYPHNTTSTIVSTFLGPPAAASEEETQATPGDNSQVIQLLCSAAKGSIPPLVGTLAQEFEDRRQRTRQGWLGDVASVPENSHVVVFLDDRHVQLQGGEEQKYYLASFQHLARSAASLTVLTSCGIIKGRNPDGALIPGLLRVLRTENPSTKFLSVDINGDQFETSGELETGSSGPAHCIADRVISLQGYGDGKQDEDNDNPLDYEFAWQDGCLWVSRYAAVPDDEVPASSSYYSPDGQSPKEAEMALLPLDSHNAVRAAFGTPGVLGSLYFEPDKETLTPLPPGFVDVKVTAVGLDQDDLDGWSGRADTTSSISEFTGLVAGTGPSLDGFEVGDRVCGLALGRLQVGNSARVAGSLVLKVQSEDFGLRLGMALRAYATAIYVLEHVAHLAPQETWLGKTVLVQSAGTAVGIATVMIARSKDADVYATVRSDQDADQVIQETGISPSHVFSLEYGTRNLRRVAAAAPKGQFDIILSTSEADLEFTYETQYLLASPSYLVHTGRVQDLNAAFGGGLNMGLLVEKNCTFSLVNLATLLGSSPELGHQLLNAVEKYEREGVVKPARLFGGGITDVADLPRELAAFSKAEGRDVGKLIVSFQRPSSEVKMVPPVPTAQFNPQASYVVTGALGGLGRCIVRWMVDHGARHLILLSRRPANTVPAAQHLVEELASRSVDLRSVVCDVADVNQVKSALANPAAPIRGVVHAAVSWQDLSFEKLSSERWQESLAAKVQGSKNLHTATLDMPLDFFVMTTSLLSVYALATQAAYTAANNFQDAFARHRRALGLPASTVSFSLIRDVGDTGSDQSTVATFERNQTMILNERQFLALFESAFVPSSDRQVSVPAFDLGDAQDSLTNANLITCLDPVAMVSKLSDDGEHGTGSTPRWYSDGRVSLILRGFADAQQYAIDRNSARDPAAGGGGGKSSLTARLQQDLDAGIRGGIAQRSATVALVEAAITATVASMLFIDPEGVDPAKSVADYGVDSLIAAELRSWFVDALKTDISMLKLLDQKTNMGMLAARVVDDALARTVPKGRSEE